MSDALSRRAYRPAVRAEVSSNVVGYQNKGLEGGYNFTLSTFKAVSGVAKLGDIKCNEAVNWGGTDLQLLDEGGAVATITIEGYGDVPGLFQYVPAAYASEDMPEGWYVVDPDDEDGNPLVDFPQNGREIPFGQGYLMNSFDDGAVITYAGQVADAGFELELAGGYNFTGNASPSPMTLGDFTCNEAVNWGGTDLQLLDDTGAVDTITIEGYGDVPGLFQYVPAAYATEDMPEGWYVVDPDDEDGNPLVDYPQNGRVIPAGQGFLMNCFDDGAVVTLPSAL